MPSIPTSSRSNWAGLTVCRPPSTRMSDACPTGCLTSGWSGPALARAVMLYRRAPAAQPDRYADRMKSQRLFLLVSLAIACQVVESVHADSSCLKESAAIVAASDLLTRQRLLNEYVASRAYGQDSGDKWNIWIPRVRG